MFYGVKFELTSIAIWVVCLYSPSLFAQEDDSKEAAEVSSGPTAPEMSSMSQEDRIRELEKEVQSLKQQAHQRNGSPELMDKVNELEQKFAAAEEERYLEAIEEDFDTTKLLDVSGFFDFVLGENFIPKGNITRNLVPSKLSFAVANLNIYLISQISETLRSLVELHFTFSPQGQETNITTGSAAYSINTYSRIDQTFIEPVTQQRKILGGVAIERVQLTWQPFEYFGITAGRFLTPFGIWNVDHGAPVIIPIIPPYFMMVDMIPLAQTGVQFQGQFFPSMSTAIDYAITVSNGRGPTEAVYDLENDKAIGLRLRLQYSGDKFFFSLGGYGYLGHTTDITKRFVLSGKDGYVAIDKKYEYREFIATIDLLMKFYGVRLQAELIRGIVKYQKRPPRTVPVFNIESPDLYQPDHIKHTVYGLISWDLPLRKHIGDMLITPFVLVEHAILDDSAYIYNPDMFMLRMGINFKPIHSVVLKASCRRLLSLKSDTLRPASWTAIGQLAVVF